MALDIGSIGVSVVINVIIVIIILFLSVNKAIIPILSAVIDEKLQEVSNMQSAAASALGTKSGEVRTLSKMTDMVIEDIIAEYPEIELALERFSPETAEYIRENPRAALILYQRYKPFIDSITGTAQKERVQYDIS